MSQTEKKFNWGEISERDFPGRCGITITICNSDDATLSHLGNAQADTNSTNRQKKNNHQMDMDIIKLSKMKKNWKH